MAGVKAPTRKNLIAEIPVKCPHCQASLVGGEIPPEEKHLYKDSSHYSKLMALEINGVPRYWHCWRCEVNWDIGKPFPTHWWEEL